MEYNLKLTQKQKLVLTEKLKLSLKVLQLSNYDLENFIQKEVEKNPALDIEYKQIETYKSDNSLKEYKCSNYNDKTEYISPFYFISEKKSFNEYLKEQISESEEKDNVKNICNFIIENIDDKGYLEIEKEHICKVLDISSDLLEYSIKVVQNLDPPGVAAKNLKECLAIQLKRKNIKDKNIFYIIDNYLNYLAENKYLNIAEKLNISVEKAQKYGDIIKSLEPKPSRGFYTGESIKYIVPDAYVKNIKNQCIVIINDKYLPKVIINDSFKELSLIEDEKVEKYVKEKIHNGLQLIESIDERKSTLYKVINEIVNFQKDYFLCENKSLKPMRLKNIAYNLNVSEATISRAIKDKYICTDKGNIKIKDLFTIGIVQNYSEEISSNNIKNRIKKLINEENKKNPLSDQKICEILNHDNINISRRTVAKYRESMDIRASKYRKRF